MTPTIQPGMHPDAESLTLFAEQQLPAAEREQILTHMATCDRCREVVFLAQKAAGEDEPGIATVHTQEPSRPERRWLASWRWMWVPIAALAGIAGVAVMQHFRNAPQPEPQLAGNVAPSDALQKAQSAPVAPVSSPSTESVQQAKEKTPASPRRIVPHEVQKGGTDQLDENKPSEERYEAIGGAGGAMGALGGLTAAPMHGTVTARAKGQSLGGPMAANQAQQQNANQIQQGFLEQKAAPARQNSPVLRADKPVTAPVSPGATTQTVTVQAEPQIPQAAPAPAPPMTLSLAKNETVEINGRQVAGMKKLAKIVLPSGSEVLSSASAAGRTIALDTAGALFMREGDQKHWQAVSAQWTGRAVLVRARQVPAASADALAVVQVPRFELVTDKLQTWVSADGKTWTAETVLPK